jgi:hypothetical protein
LQKPRHIFNCQSAKKAIAGKGSSICQVAVNTVSPFGLLQICAIKNLNGSVCKAPFSYAAFIFHAIKAVISHKRIPAGAAHSM